MNNCCHRERVRHNSQSRRPLFTERKVPKRTLYFSARASVKINMPEVSGDEAAMHPNQSDSRVSPVTSIVAYTHLTESPPRSATRLDDGARWRGMVGPRKRVPRSLGSVAVRTPGPVGSFPRCLEILEKHFGPRRVNGEGKTGERERE